LRYFAVAAATESSWGLFVRKRLANAPKTWPSRDDASLAGMELLVPAAIIAVAVGVIAAFATHKIRFPSDPS
jgi:hypothetical protein